jgi:predicted nucleic acid-binding Zn ribbon protein
MGWRPLPGDDHAPPARVGDVVGRVLRHLGAPSATSLETVFGQWPALVGDRIAANAEPVAIQRGTLTVRVSDAAWGNQLRWLERDLVAQLERSLGPDVVRAIEVRVGPPGGGRERPGRSTRGRAGVRPQRR